MSSSLTLAVIAPILKQYSSYARKSKEWIDRYQAKGGKVYCAAGCYKCCDMPIRLSLAEAVIVAGSLSGEQITRVALHAAAVQKNARTATSEDMYAERHRTEVGFCPLLDRDTGSCTQYESRPTRCRDTYSAFSSKYCGAGALGELSRSEKSQYMREVRKIPVTDGMSHYIAPLENMSEVIWEAASKSMRKHWGLEVWGDFWTLTTLALDSAFLDRIERGDLRGATQRAKQLGLAHPVTLEIFSQ